MTLAARLQESHENREAWRYTKLEPYASHVLALPSRATVPDVPAALGRHRLVFVDGSYRAELSTFPDLPEGFLTQEADDSVSLELSGQTCLAIDPVELLFMDTAQSGDTEAQTNLKIYLGESSRLTLIERHITTQPALHARHIHLDIKLERQAKLIHGKIVAGKGGALHLAQTHVSVDSGAFYDHFGLISGAKLVRCEQEVELIGPMAETRLLGVMLMEGERHGDITSLVRHMAPHTASRQICKAVLNDKSHGVYQGKVFVAKGAQKTDGYQLCRALLLSDKAEMDAKPELEIYADDVKCSHGAAIGDLDEEALFYLISRGIDPATARTMLVEAFVQELVDQGPSGAIQDALHDEVTTWLA